MTGEKHLKKGPFSNKAKQRLLSGIKPTGSIHIGNYFGAMKQFLDLQDQYDCFIFIADYHGLNQIYNPQLLSHYSQEIIKAYLAIGLDPKKVTLFKQSDIAPVLELTWIFNCITPMGLLKRAHAYKDALAKKQPVNMGLFCYPVLMATDILIYKSHLVPVGQDQAQHIEMAREIAKKFNHLFGKTFIVPRALIKKEVAVVKGLDGRKMSKSYKNTIELFESEATTRKKVMSIVTDSRPPEEPKDPESCNIFALHKLFSKKDLRSIAKAYEKGKISYKESKEILAKNINDLLRPFRKRKKELDKNPDYVKKILTKGKEKALFIANQTLKEVKKKIGVEW